MSAQVTLSSGTPTQQERLLSHLIESKDGAWHHMVVHESGKLGLTEAWHGSENRWDWGVTAWHLDHALLEWKRLDGLHSRMSAHEREQLWASDSLLARQLRCFLRGGRQ